MKLVSACLLGINCRYDGGNCNNQKIIDLSKSEILIPVCPEQLSGLATPRSPNEIQKGNYLMNKEGKNTTEFFKKGAKETLKIAKILKINEFIGKSKSPSCSCFNVYDGTFKGNLKPGLGITARLLKKIT